MIERPARPATHRQIPGGSYVKVDGADAIAAVYIGDAIRYLADVLAAAENVAAHTP